MQIYELNTSSIEHNLEARKVGNYWLYLTNETGESVVKYVGRSDKCLNKRLKRHVSNGKYDCFSFQYSITHPKIKNAFDIECREYHLFNDRIDNVIHPDAPRHLPYTCKYCKLDVMLSNREASNEGVDIV
jgi:hypothetical protein